MFGVSQALGEYIVEPGGKHCANTAGNTRFAKGAEKFKTLPNIGEAGANVPLCARTNAYLVCYARCTEDVQDCGFGTLERHQIRSACSADTALGYLTVGGLCHVFALRGPE